VRSRTYEITFVGQAGSALHAEFDDCEIIMGPDTTTIRAQVPDQGALWGLVERIIGFGLDAPAPRGHTGAAGRNTGRGPRAGGRDGGSKQLASLVSG